MDIAFRHFRLGLMPRFITVAMCYGAAVVMQLAGFGPLGMLLVLPAWFILDLKPITNKPKDQGLEEWRAVSDGEITRIADSIKTARKLRLTQGGRKVLQVLLFIVLFIVANMLSFASPGLGMVASNFVLFAVPALFAGKVTIFIPADLDMKMSGFLTLLNSKLPKAFTLTPYLRFDKDKDGLDVPEDIRFMLEPRRKPADLIGVQLQSSINNGANGKVPYMYAVALCHGQSGTAYRAFSGMKARGFIVEAGGDDAYGTVVVRQQTTGTGYHTKDADCQRLFDLMLQALKALAA